MLRSKSARSSRRALLTGMVALTFLLLCFVVLIRTVGHEEDPVPPVPRVEKLFTVTRPPLLTAENPRETPQPTFVEPHPSIPWTVVPNTGGNLLKKVLVSSSGALPTIGATLSVHYVGTLARDGSRFDSSYDRGTPFVFPLGAGRVIRGWDVGLATIRFGEKAILRCSPSFAYGDRGYPPLIPGNATLDFVVELLAN